MKIKMFMGGGGCAIQINVRTSKYSTLQLVGAEQEYVQQDRRILHRRAEVRDGPPRGVRVAAPSLGGGQSAADDEWLGLHAQASVGPVGLDGLHQHRLHDLDQQNSHLLEATGVQSGKESPSEQGIVEGGQSVRIVQQKRKQVFHRNSHAQQNFQPDGTCEAAALGTEGEGPTTAPGVIADLCQQRDAPEGHFGRRRYWARDARHVEDRFKTEGGQDTLSTAEEKI